MLHSQRKVRNLLLKPLLQIKLGLYSIILSVVFALTVGFILTSSFERLFHFVLELTDARDQVMMEVTLQFQTMIQWLSIVTFAYIALIIGLSISYTHRLIGPTIAFRRHIRSLIDQKFQSRVILRNGDAFSEVAEDLNELASVLERQSKK